VRESVAVASAKERAFAAASVAGGVGALGILYLVNPSTSTLYPTCPFFWPLPDAIVRDAEACGPFTRSRGDRWRPHSGSILC
jgi:hypothetical protein